MRLQPQCLSQTGERSGKACSVRLVHYVWRERDHS